MLKRGPILLYVNIAYAYFSFMGSTSTIRMIDKPQNHKTPHECVRGGNIVNKGVLTSN